MDATTAHLVDYTLGYAKHGLDPVVRDATLNHLLDTVAVAIAGTTAEASVLAADIATAWSGQDGATVIGTGRKGLPNSRPSPTP